MLILSGCLEPNTENLWSLDKLTTVNTIGYCRHLDIHDNLAFIAAGQGGIQVWDLTPFYDSNDAPILKTHLQINADLGLSKDINQVVYSEITSQIIGLETFEKPFLVDYFNPDKPSATGQLMSENTVEFIVIDDSLALTIIAADEDDGIKISHFTGFVINDSTILYQPHSDLEVAVNGSPSGIAISGSLLALTKDQLGVALYLYQGPATAPILIDEKDTESSAESVTFYGTDGLFVASGAGGCYYFEIEANKLWFMDEKAHFARDLRVQHVAYSGTMAALSLGSHGVALYDISDPSRPESRGVHEIGHVYFTVFENDYLFAATREGLQIFNIGI